jgi:cob(I)alamin adenosyltransferase
VYTGGGKGKTTAAIGLAIRAMGAGKRVLFLQFMKGKVYSEHRILKRFAPDLVLETLGKPFFVAREDQLDAEALAKLKDQCVVFPPGQPPAEYVELVKKGMDRAREAVQSGEFDLVVLDEINMALHFGLAELADLEAVLDRRKRGVEVVLTGRNAPQAIVDRADLVTEMREVKHYYASCEVCARKGIES